MGDGITRCPTDARGCFLRAFSVFQVSDYIRLLFGPQRALETVGQMGWKLALERAFSPTNRKATEFHHPPRR